MSVGQWFQEWCAGYTTGLHNRAYNRFVSQYQDTSAQVDIDVPRTLSDIIETPWDLATVRRMMRAHMAIHGQNSYAQGMLMPLRAAHCFLKDESLAWWAMQDIFGKLWMFSPPCSRFASRVLADSTQHWFPSIYNAIESHPIAADIQWSIILTRDWSTLFTGYATTLQELSTLWQYLLANHPSRELLWKRMAALQAAIWLFALPPIQHSESGEVMGCILQVKMDTDASTIVGVAKCYERSKHS